MASIRDKGGGDDSSSFKKRSSKAGSPSTSITKRPVWFLTNPHEAKPQGQGVNKRSEADSLDNSLHGDCPSLHRDVHFACLRAHANSSGYSKTIAPAPSRRFS